MKILNAYSGIGGNRKFWGDEHGITAVESKPEIAKIYKDFFPDDEVIVADAHAYMLEHYKEFDFIWSSPPCPTHSKIRFVMSETNKKVGSKLKAHKPKYPDMKLYEEIIFLKHNFRGLWCVENVIAYYEPLIPPQELGGHLFWTNFIIPPYNSNETRGHDIGIRGLENRKGFDLTPYTDIDKRLALRNCVEPELGAHVMRYALNPLVLQQSIF